MIETGIMDATIEDTDLGLKRGGEIEVDPETGQKSPAGSGATQEKEEGEDIKMRIETEREIGGIGNRAGAGRSTGRGEVGALDLMPICTGKADQWCRRTRITPLTLSAKRPHLHPRPNTHTTSTFQTTSISKPTFETCQRPRPTHRSSRLDQTSTVQTSSPRRRLFSQTRHQDKRHQLLNRAS